MIIKQREFSKHLANAKPFRAYLLTGSDFFLLEEAFLELTKTWQSNQTPSTTVHLFIENANDWDDLSIQSQSSFLFSPRTLIDLRYDKKTLDTSGKQALLRYLDTCTDNSLLVIRAPHLTMNQLTALKNVGSLCITTFYPLTPAEMQQWVKNQLNQRDLHVDVGVPALIIEHTKGNMAACAQALEKMQLVAQGKKISLTDTKSQLFDQNQHQLSELSDAWLLGNASTLLHQLKYAHDSETEARILLWMLTQDIRQLLQLNALTAQGMLFEQACRQQNIWSTKVKLFQHASKTKSKSLLIELLQRCQRLDLKMKTEKNLNIYQCIEQIAISLCLNKPVGLSW